MLLSQYVGKVGLFDDKRGKLKSAQKNLGVWIKGWKGNVSFFIIFTHIWRWGFIFNLSNMSGKTLIDRVKNRKENSPSSLFIACVSSFYGKPLQ